MSTQVNVQFALSHEGLPATSDIKRWAQAALADRRKDAQLTVRIVDTQEGVRLNQGYRQRPGATNVLSFPFVPSVQIGVAANVQNYLGDLVICAPVVECEAHAQHKDLTAHWAHMVVHGSLHLLGYDHLDEQQAHTMETLESAIVTRMGYPDPYLIIENV